MKKHLLRALLFTCGLLFLCSCLKDDPKNNSTVYYGFQKIPNINEFMPQRLLKAMDSLHCLHYGDEPPKIEGKFMADAVIIDSYIVLDSLWMPHAGPMPVIDYYEFYNQHKGIAKLHFKRPYLSSNGTPFYIESSISDTTYSIINQGNNYNLFLDDSIAPSYFSNGYSSKDDFNTIYIMGKDPYFTIYYYEVRNLSSKTEPLNAIIISGKMGSETVIMSDTINHTTDTIVRPVIQNFRLGLQNMLYYKKDSPAYSIYVNNGSLPLPGDVLILTNSTNLTYGEYNE